MASPRPPELLPQVADVRVQGPVERRGRALEQGDRQLAAGDDPAGGPDEVFEDVVLDRRQGDRRAVRPAASRAARSSRNPPASRTFGPSCAAARPAEHGPDAGQQHVRPERLGQVVVGPGVEAGDPVGLRRCGPSA